MRRKVGGVVLLSHGHLEGTESFVWAIYFGNGETFYVFDQPLVILVFNICLKMSAFPLRPLEASSSFIHLGCVSHITSVLFAVDCKPQCCSGNGRVGWREGWLQSSGAAVRAGHDVRMVT